MERAASPMTGCNRTSAACSRCDVSLQLQLCNVQRHQCKVQPQRRHSATVRVQRAAAPDERAAAPATPCRGRIARCSGTSDTLQRSECTVQPHRCSVQQHQRNVRRQRVQVSRPARTPALPVGPPPRRTRRSWAGGRTISSACAGRSGSPIAQGFHPGLAVRPGGAMRNAWHRGRAGVSRLTRGALLPPALRCPEQVETTRRARPACIEGSPGASETLREYGSRTSASRRWNWVLLLPYLHAHLHITVPAPHFPGVSMNAGPARCGV